MEFSLTLSSRRKKLSLSQRRRLYKQVYKKYKTECYICGVKLRNDSKTIDHVQPLSLWGTNDIANLRPCCKKCNSKKGNYTIHQFQEKYLIDEVIDSMYGYDGIPDDILS